MIVLFLFFSFSFFLSLIIHTIVHRSSAFLFSFVAHTRTIVELETRQTRPLAWTRADSCAQFSKRGEKIYIYIYIYKRKQKQRRVENEAGEGRRRPLMAKKNAATRVAF